MTTKQKVDTTIKTALLGAAVTAVFSLFAWGINLTTQTTANAEAIQTNKGMIADNLVVIRDELKETNTRLLSIETTLRKSHQ